MIGRRSFEYIALLALAASAAACSGDSTAPRSRLSSEEAAGLAMQLNYTLSAAMPTTAAVASRMGVSASSAPEPISFSVDQQVACPMGGESHVVASMSGTVDNATESMDVTLNGSQSPANCGFDVNGVTFHTNGDPSLESTAHVVMVNGLPAGIMSFTGKGKFSWTADDGREPGSCSVDYTMTLNYTTQRAVVHGSFCGTNLDYDGPLGD
jgi:hypothetical protein